MGKGIGGGTGVGEGAGEGAGAYRGRQERIAVPAMPMPMAVVCCVLNFILPGFGTMFAGLSNFFCSRNEDISDSDRWMSCLINFGIGCAQFVTVLVLLIGWVWSIAWGIFFIGMSSEYYHRNRPEYTDGRGGVVISTQPGLQLVTLNAGVQSTPIAQQHVTTVVRQPAGVQYGQPVISAGPAVITTTVPAYNPTNQLYPNMSVPPPYPGPPKPF